jgi:hypothetical protein
MSGDAAAGFSITLSGEIPDPHGHLGQSQLGIPGVPGLQEQTR